jgi:hypothetical protein
MKPYIFKTDDALKSHRSYSIQEILAAGGPTAFALKTGKTNEALIKALESCPPIEPFTDEEWDDLLSDLKMNK